MVSQIIPQHKGWGWGWCHRSFHNTRGGGGGGVTDHSITQGVGWEYGVTDHSTTQRVGVGVGVRCYTSLYNLCTVYIHTYVHTVDICMQVI